MTLLMETATAVITYCWLTLSYGFESYYDGCAEKPGAVLLFWTSEPAPHTDSVSRVAFKGVLVVVQLFSVVSPAVSRRRGCLVRDGHTCSK